MRLLVVILFFALAVYSKEVKKEKAYEEPDEYESYVLAGEPKVLKIPDPSPEEEEQWSRTFPEIPEYKCLKTVMLETEDCDALRDLIRERKKLGKLMKAIQDVLAND